MVIRHGKESQLLGGRGSTVGENEGGVFVREGVSSDLYLLLFLSNSNSRKGWKAIQTDKGEGKIGVSFGLRTLPRALPFHYAFPLTALKRGKRKGERTREKGIRMEVLCPNHGVSGEGGGGGFLKAEGKAQSSSENGSKTLGIQ